MLYNGKLNAFNTRKYFIYKDGEQRGVVLVKIEKFIIDEERKKEKNMQQE